MVETVAKHEAAKRWVRAVNHWGQLGRWHFEACWDPQWLGAALRLLAVAFADEQLTRCATGFRTREDWRGSARKMMAMPELVASFAAQHPRSPPRAQIPVRPPLHTNVCPLT